MVPDGVPFFGPGVGKNLDLLREKTEFEDRLQAIQAELEMAGAENRELSDAKVRVEKENVEKERSVSELTKQVHGLEMEKLQLSQENQALKEQVQKLSVPVQPAPSEAAPAVPPQN
jgi:hypothetical protein